MHRHNHIKTLRTDSVIKEIMSHDLISKKLEEEMYKRDRYKLDSTLALFSFENEAFKDLYMEEIQNSKLLRIVDKIYLLSEPKTFLIIYEFTDEQDAFKAAQNLISKLEAVRHSVIKVGLSNITDKKDIYDWLRATINALKETHDHFGTSLFICQY